jgi:hypothetical protein
MNVQCTLYSECTELNPEHGKCPTLMLCVSDEIGKQLTVITHIVGITCLDVSFMGSELIDGKTSKTKQKHSDISVKIIIKWI